MILGINNIPTVSVGKTGIKIKKSHQGLFTKYCNGKVTQKCIDKAKRSGNPTLVKRAVFAENSRKWSKKHLIGGVIPKAKNGFKNPYKHGDKYCESNECAYFSNHTLNDNGYMISGNAWNPRGVDSIYNGFEGLTKPNTFNTEDYDTYARNAVKNVYNNFITRQQLNPNEVYTVNMFYSNSPNKEKAFNESNGVYGTHTGYLNYDQNDDTWYVTHNIHGKIYKQKFGQLQNPEGQIGVTAIYKPRKNTIVNRIKTKLGFKKGGSIHKPNGHRSILDNGWIPTNRLKKRTYGLIKNINGK